MSKTLSEMAIAIREDDCWSDYKDYNQYARSALSAIHEPDPHAVAKAADVLNITPTLAYAVWVTMIDYMSKENGE